MIAQPDLFGAPPTKELIEARRERASYFKWLTEAIPYHKTGNNYQQHIARMEENRAIDILGELGGLAGEW